MAMEKVGRKDAIGKAEFHKRLFSWLESDEEQIGPLGEFERNAWIHIREGDLLYKLDPDTSREAVISYCEKVRRYGDAIEWTLVPSQRGNLTAVAVGPNRDRVTPFYLYRVLVKKRPSAVC